jgi:predicted dehydrogenase
MAYRTWPLYIILLVHLSCQPPSSAVSSDKNSKVKILTLDPGHFHAALVQKKMYGEVDSTVHVYAPVGPDVNLHLSRIEAYNKRPDSSTAWKEVVYTGPDFFDRMLQEKKGNVVILAGNNQKKTSYIKHAIDAGFHVLADKPMAIDRAGFELLQTAFANANKKNLLLYDIMTERYEITTMLQRAFSLLPGVFGQLEKGTAGNPAVTKESVHYFFKYVSGNVLQRPPWFMDVLQEGEGIVDVTTHLVDLVQWECFPEEAIDYKKDITLVSARRWSTPMTLSQFGRITRLNAFPAYLKNAVTKDSVLDVFSNGEISYQLRGVHAKVSVTWGFEAPPGTGDTHHSNMRGTKANLVIRQGAEQNHKPALYIEPVAGITQEYETAVQEALVSITKEYPGVTLGKTAAGWEVIIPERYKEGHEAHFARVMEKFLEYHEKGNMPDWEVPNMIAKYYLTTSALELARNPSK